MRRKLVQRAVDCTDDQIRMKGCKQISLFYAALEFSISVYLKPIKWEYPLEVDTYRYLTPMGISQQFKIMCESKCPSSFKIMKNIFNELGI